jgi:hypothetical protein
MGMAVVMDGAFAADAGIITDGAEVVATTMVGDIIGITGNLTSISPERPPPTAASFASGRTSMTRAHQQKTAKRFKPRFPWRDDRIFANGVRGAWLFRLQLRKKEVFRRSVSLWTSARTFATGC